MIATCWCGYQAASQRLFLAVLDLVADPYSPNSIEMRDGAGRRLRVGDYRVIYSVEADELTIHAVGHRKDVYDR